MGMSIEDIYALTNFEDHNAAIKYLLPFWEKYRKIEQILDDCLLDDSEILQIVKGIVNE